MKSGQACALQAPNYCVHTFLDARCMYSTHPCKMGRKSQNRALVHVLIYSLVSLTYIPLKFLWSLMLQQVIYLRNSTWSLTISLKPSIHYHWPWPASQKTMGSNNYIEAWMFYGCQLWWEQPSNPAFPLRHYQVILWSQKVATRKWANGGYWRWSS